jgi:hypothetical protein
MTRLLFGFLFSCLIARAQFVLSVVENGADRDLAPGSIYQMKPIESGERAELVLRVRNTSTRRATLETFIAEGAGFVLNRGLPPIGVEPGAFELGYLIFNAGVAANYSATLTFNSSKVQFQIQVSAGPTLTIPSTCNSPTEGLIEFGLVERGKSKTCDLTLRNATNRAMRMNTLAVSGAGFRLLNSGPLPTLAPGATMPVQVLVEPVGPGVLNGQLQIQGRSYPLHAVGTEPEVPPIPAPLLEFDAAPASGQQRRLTLRLPAPATQAGAGTLTLTFTPDASFNDDKAIQFVPSNNRQLRFTVTQGSTSVQLDGQPFATFQTGTTAGRIQFTAVGSSGRFGGVGTLNAVLLPAPMQIERLIATRFPDRMELAITGFDNTYSAGHALFRFYDTNGQPMNVAIPADFTTQFRDFYSRNPGGSTFTARVAFPVSGSSTSIAEMEAEFATTAGTTRTDRLKF